MPWPDYSELTFGFAFLREFEAMCGNSMFPTAPDFISQRLEHQLGYDVSVTVNSIPIFFQFKRSFVLSSKRAKEIQAGCFKHPPLFRMNLHKKDNYNQHRRLQCLERPLQHPEIQRHVYYVTSQVSTKCEFNEAFRNRSVVSEAAAMFSPNEIILPPTDEAHHVTFEANADIGYVFSELDEPFKRKYPHFEAMLSMVREKDLNSKEDNLEFFWGSGVVA